MALNGLSVHFVEYGITQHTKNLWMNPISCLMVVRIPTIVNNHTIYVYIYIYTYIHTVKPVLNGPFIKRNLF
jgi:hypothetical protein